MAGVGRREWTGGSEKAHDGQGSVVVGRSGLAVVKCGGCGPAVVGGERV